LVRIGREQPAHRWSDSADIWHDDGVEIFLDIGNDKSVTYGSDDFQRLFRYQDDELGRRHDRQLLLQPGHGN